MSWIRSLENDAGDGKVFAKLNTMHAISRFGGGEVYSCYPIRSWQL
jgi:hypothetical protein